MISTLILLDVLVALTMWQVAIVLQGALGRGQLTEIAAASVVPNVVAWVGVRAVLGSYPGYGLDQVESVAQVLKETCTPG